MSGVAILRRFWKSGGVESIEIALSVVSEKQYSSVKKINLLRQAEGSGAEEQRRKK